MAWLRRCAPLLLLLSGACTDTEPYNRAGMWRPTGANARNMATMAAYPRDLIRGHGDGANANGRMSAEAVTRLNNGTPKPLLSIGAGAAPGGDPAAAAPAAPGAPGAPPAAAGPI